MRPTVLLILFGSLLLAACAGLSNRDVTLTEGRWRCDGELVTTALGDRSPQCFRSGGRFDALTARGNEPGWHVTLTPDNATLTMDYGQTTGELSAVQFRMRRAHKQTTQIAGQFRGQSATLLLTDALCQDTMSGMFFPLQAELALGKRTLKGCAGETLWLLTGGPWKIRQIGGQTFTDNSALSIQFDAEGNYFGHGGCNRYRGMYRLSGESLMFDNTASTLMACGEQQMADEQHLYDALGGVRGVMFKTHHQARLIGSDEMIIQIERQ